MRKQYFIIALIFIGETCFRLAPKYDPGNPPPTYDLFLLSDNHVSVLNYVYYFFEHVKVIGLVACLVIENTRYRWLLGLFIADLVVYLLNYSSTITYMGGVPLGMDLVKLIILGIVVINEALIYHGRRTNSSNTRSFLAYAHGHLSTASWVQSCKNVFGRGKKVLLRSFTNSKIS